MLNTLQHLRHPMTHGNTLHYRNADSANKPEDNAQGLMLHWATPLIEFLEHHF